MWLPIKDTATGLGGVGKNLGYRRGNETQFGLIDWDDLTEDDQLDVVTEVVKRWKRDNFTINEWIESCQKKNQ